MLWPLDRSRRRAALLPRLHRGGAGGPQRLLRVPDRAAGAAVPRGAPPAEDVRHRVVLRRAGGAGRRGVRSRSARSAASRSTASMRVPVSGAGTARSTALYPQGDQWYWRADYVRDLTDEAIEATRRVRRAAPDHAIDHAPLSGQRRRRTASRTTTTAWAYRDARYAEVIVGVDPDPANAEKHHGLDDATTGRAAPLLHGRRLRELHDGRRARSASRRPTATTTRDWRRSSAPTTRTTSSTSTRTSDQQLTDCRCPASSGTRGYPPSEGVAVSTAPAGARRGKRRRQAFVVGSRAARGRDHGSGHDEQAEERASRCA